MEEEEFKWLAESAHASYARYLINSCRDLQRHIQIAEQKGWDFNRQESEDLLHCDSSELEDILGTLEGDLKEDAEKCLKEIGR